MKILKPIEFFYNLRLNITKMLTKGSNDVSDMKLEKLKNDYNKLEVKDSIRDFEINMRYKKTLRKTKIITFFIFFGFITSICLTLAGTNKINFFDLNTFNTPNITYCSVIVFLQAISYIVKSKESTIKEKYYNHYWGFKIAQWCIILSSIYYNFRFFLMYFENMNTIEMIITFFICAGLDITTINLIGLKNDMKNNVMSYRKNKKLITLQKEKCNQEKIEPVINSLHDENDSLHYITKIKDVTKNKNDSLQKQDETTDNTESNQCNHDVTKNENDDTLQKKDSLQENNSLQDSLQNSLQDEKCNVINSLQNEKCNEAKNENETNSLHYITKKIDVYISEKYKIDELVSVKKIKEKFNIKQQRKWAKIINLLESAKIINGRLRRIETKNNIKVVK